MLHVALVAWLAGCTAAAWWQIARAGDGNSLSYMYAVEWPVFGVLGVAGWWALLHAEDISEEEKLQRRAFEEHQRREVFLARESAAVDDPSLAAYNEHLAQLADRPKKKMWGH